MDADSPSIELNKSAPGSQLTPLVDPYEGVVERYEGVVRVPVGIAGPVRIHGRFADGEFRIPLATTEGALVASCHRGCRALNAAGGVTALVLAEAMVRAPGFRFEDALDAHQFATWAVGQHGRFADIAAATSNHCRLVAVAPLQEGNHCFLRFEYQTGEAAGQNMVTFASDAICQYIAASAPVTPTAAYLEANFSSDKKASQQTLAGVRGKKVTAEVRLDAFTLKRILHCTAAQIEAYWTQCVMGAVQTGAVGLQGHYANVLAGIYTALGQDVACVAESSIGITRFTREGNALYASVTLPGVVVGSVGGGSALPDQARYLDRMGLAEHDRARTVAEIIAAACLAAELSISASLATGSFARAHRIFGRRRTENCPEQGP